MTRNKDAMRKFSIKKGTGHARHEDCSVLGLPFPVPIPDSVSPSCVKCPPSEEETCHWFRSNNTSYTAEKWPYYWIPFTPFTLYFPGNQNKEFHFRICGNLNPFADRSRINIRTVYSRSLIFFSKLNIQSQWEFPAKTVGTPDLPGPDFWLWIHRWIDNTDLILRDIDRKEYV